MNLPPIILASESPRRIQLLKEMELDFQVVPARTAEFHHEHLTPNEVAQLNAHRKARAVAKKFPDALVLGADTIVSIGMQILGKPRNMAEAEQMLKQLQGKTHHVITGVCLIHLRGHHERLFSVTSKVRFKPLRAPEIREYLEAVNPLDKAGAYGIQEKGEMLVAKLLGSRTNVMGLPMERLREELEHWLHPEAV